MVDPWWSLLGAAIPALTLIAGQAIRMKRKRNEEQKPKIQRARDRVNNNNTNNKNPFVCERVCTSKRMLKKVGSTTDTCVTVCGVSGVDACADACARAVCANQHQVPNWNDICLRKCQSECLRLSHSSVLP
ncbi:hypothetical protein COLO4_35234 [Corchorus olitorius]|uniref:Uncharacterized protein n=1 Tax=Corchorus olitorius TaxID=93759 RepID=A0A1R3GHQ5_9ROSI|nr:hypothetical protein COLO4_35234 [Corchorus olitorius]